MRVTLSARGCSAALFAILTTLAAAQSPTDLFSKAPPEIDNALRERVSKFYQAHVEGKFRVADQYVSEDSKDTFFESDKRRCRKFEIVKLTYEKDFALARAVVNCDTEMLMPPKGLMRVTMPVASSWRVESGNWFWFVEPRTRESSFGTMKAGEGEGTAQLPKGPTPADLRKMIEVDETEFRVVPDEGLTRLVKVTNNMLGVVELRLEKLNAPDIKVSFDRKELKPTESATLTIEFIPDKTRLRNPRTSEEIHFSVLPTNQKLFVRLNFVR